MPKKKKKKSQQRSLEEFYIMTGFHGIHVFLGTIMLVVIAFRIYYDDFSPERHFAFEAVSWYWHFVDVIWLLLFVFVYWL